MKRKALSKRKRFDVLKRDSFTCCYCGSTPPKVVLEVDHIIPVSKGGDNNLLNLTTSCFDCNRGKSNKELTEIPNAIDFDSERLVQYKQYVKYVKDKAKIRKQEIDMVCEVFENHKNNKWTPSDKYRSTIGQFLDKLSLEQVIDAMERACNSRADGDIKYFCGVCWRIIKGD